MLCRSGRAYIEDAFKNAFLYFFRESARKTRSIVAFRDGERHFANDAYNTVKLLLT